MAALGNRSKFCKAEILSNIMLNVAPSCLTELSGSSTKYGGDRRRPSREPFKPQDGKIAVDNYEHIMRPFVAVGKKI